QLSYPFLLTTPTPPKATLFPYTTLFRSRLEDLRSLHRPEVFGITGYPTIGHVHNAPRQRLARNAANGPINLGQQPLDQARARKWAHRVMYQDGFDLFRVDPGSDRLETGELRTMPHIATGDDRAQLGESSLQAFARVKVRSSSDKHDVVDVPARLEQSQR